MKFCLWESITKKKEKKYLYGLNQPKLTSHLPDTCKADNWFYLRYSSDIAAWLSFKQKRPCFLTIAKYPVYNQVFNMSWNLGFPEKNELFDLL